MSSAPPPDALLHPIIALVSLTAAVWLAMVVVRNVAVQKGTATVGYYKGYTGTLPPEWVERPARAFMNLLEVPVLFYLVCVLMLVTGRYDQLQVELAWLFVAIRTAHALIHIFINHVLTRFTAYLAGCVTLAVMWVRFAT
jgi:hypothetical protein